MDSVANLRDRIRDCFPFPEHQDITNDYDLAVQLQFLLEKGTIVTISQDGTSSFASHMGRRGPLTFSDKNLWCHTVLIIQIDAEQNMAGREVVDLWYPGIVVGYQEYTESLRKVNKGLPIQGYDEDLEEVYDL